MHKKILFILFMLSFSMFGQDTWKQTRQETTDDVVFVESHMPTKFSLYAIDVEEISEELRYVETREEMSVSESGTLMSFPDETGEMISFKMVEWSILSTELAGKFPMIKSYVGQSTKSAASLTMSIATDGLHIMIRRTGKSTIYLDPYTRDRSKYILYTTEHLLDNTGENICEFENEVESQAQDLGKTPPIDGKLRDYDLAVACTIEYAAYHLNNQGVSAGESLATKKAAVLSAIVNTVNRIKGVYTTELGVTFTLVDDEDDLIFINSDSFNNSNAGQLIGQSQSVINSTIGSSNYDIGHTFSTGAGGLAGLGVVCNNSQKARGVTGTNAPIGDAYDIDFVAHEFGHQFGANHTFNSNTHGGCGGGNRNSSTAGEPGSGSTIMAYASLCAGVNVQGASDAYFHYFSVKEINTKVTSTSCATMSNIGNEPVANAGADYRIPKGTAYILKGQATDPDGDTISYCWEQYDTQNTSYPLVSTSTAGPAYRSLIPAISPNRFMPKFSTVTGGSLQTTWEVTPTVARVLNFALTTRDNGTNGGQTDYDNMKVTVINTSSAFSVTSHSTSEMWSSGDSKTITWNVAGTTASTINTANVKISLVDSDGNQVSVLAASTPNDGSQVITVPSTVSSNTRIMVSAIGNIYYAINAADIGLNVANACTDICASNANITSYDYVINNVVFNTIDNTSANVENDYTDYTDISTTVHTGESYDLTLTNYTDGNSYPSAVVVWIDWDSDCTFNTTDEQYLFPDLVLGEVSATISIAVPASAAPGIKTMRISMKNANTTTYNTSCVTGGFIGEVEDYSVNVSQYPAAIQDVSNFDNFTLSPNPNEGSFNISLSSDSTNDVSIIVYDMIGRQIFSKEYINNQSLFNQKISLNSLQPGVYFVNVSDGIKFNSEKIIVK